MKSTVEYVQLESGDDAAAVRDRLSFIRGRRVLLIWPENGSALHRKLDLVLIQREARRRAIQLALVTHDEDVIRSAQELGISSFETIGASERKRWKRGRTRIFIQRFHKPDSTAPDDLMEAASRVRPRRVISRLRYVIVRALIVLLLSAVVISSVAIIVPGATVQITLATENINLETRITAAQDLNDVNVEAGRIPATVLRATVETSGAVPTTGVETLEDSLAIGTVVFTNETDSTVTVPAGTTVSTSAGDPILFRTTAPADVPAGMGQRVEVAIEALSDSSGTAGNVSAGLINVVPGPLENRLSVQNLNPTAGGASNALLSVTQADRDRLLGIVRGEMQSIAYTQMQDNLTADQFVIIETIQITEERNDWTTFDYEVGDITPTLSLSMRAVVEAIAVDDRFGRQIALAALSAQKPPTLVLQPDSFSYTRGPVTDLGADGSVSFTVSAQATVTAQVDADWLRTQVAGLTPPEAAALIMREVNIAPGSQPIITIEPNWLDRMPFLPVRIQIEAVSGS